MIARTSYVAVAVLLAACGKGSDRAPSDHDEPGTSAKPPVPPVPAPPPDAAYVVLEKQGLVAIENGAFRTVIADRPCGRAIPRAGGGLWVYVDKGIAAYTGQVAAIADAPEGLDPAVVAADGTLWAIGRGLASYDGTSWQRYSFDAQGVNERQSLGPIVFGGDGAMYVAAGSRLLIKRGDQWSALQPKERVEAIAAGGDGVVYVSTQSAVWKMSDGALVRVAALAAGSFPRLRAAPDGTVYVFGSNGVRRVGAKLEPLAKMPYVSGEAFGPDGSIYGFATDGMRIVHRAPDGAVEMLPKKAALPFKGKRITVDGRGRLWLVLEYGMAVIHGDELTLITPGTVPEISRNVEMIVVTGNGPELPDVGAPKLINLRGSISAKGKPKAGVKIEVCPDVSSVFSGASPCAYKSFVRRATTAVDGSFGLTDLPLGGWHIVYKKDRKTWVLYFPPGCGGGLEKGATFDMGAIEFGASS